MNWFYNFLLIKNFVWIYAFDQSTKSTSHIAVRASQQASKEFTKVKGSFFLYCYICLAPPWTETTKDRLRLVGIPLAYLLIPASWYENTRIMVAADSLMHHLYFRVTHRWRELQVSFWHLQELWINGSPDFWREFLASDYGYYTLVFIFLTLFWSVVLYFFDVKQYFK